MKTTHTVHHDAAAQRFEIHVGASTCELVYDLHDKLMRIHHTGVPGALEGQGLAAQLATAALAHARTQGWQVQPTCSYVQGYMRRHPQTLDLLAP